MRRKIMKWGVIVLGFLLVAGGIFIFVRQPDPQQMAMLGMENLSKANSFAYSITQKQSVEGKERILTRISGYKSGENIHIQGQLAGSEVEMIKIGETLYNKDPFSKEWIKFDDISVVQKVFLVELDPLATLQFKEIGEVVPDEPAEFNGKNCWVYTMKPSVQNQMIERLWSDFEYKLFVVKTAKTISKVEVKAKNKETGEPMTIVLEFKDIGRKISIQPPDAVR